MTFPVPKVSADVSEAIQAARQKLGLNQKDLAAVLAMCIISRKSMKRSMSSRIWKRRRRSPISQFWPNLSECLG